MNLKQMHFRDALVNASAHSFNRFNSPPFLKVSFSLYAPITSDECHTWFHFNAVSPAARNTEQVNIAKILFKVGFEPSNSKDTSL